MPTGYWPVDPSRYPAMTAWMTRYRIRTQMPIGQGWCTGAPSKSSNTVTSSTSGVGGASSRSSVGAIRQEFAMVSSSHVESSPLAHSSGCRPCGGRLLRGRRRGVADDVAGAVPRVRWTHLRSAAAASPASLARRGVVGCERLVWPGRDRRLASAVASAGQAADRERMSVSSA